MPINVLGIEIPTFNEWLYYLCWTIALVMFGVAWLLLRGRFGRTLRAIRDSELAAASSGVNLARYKTLAFGISAFYAGVAGSLLAIATTFVNPDTFPIALSIFLLVGVVVGGLGSLWPLVFGAIFIHFMQIEWAQQMENVIPDFLPILGDIDTDAPGRARGGVRRHPDPDHARLPGRRGRAHPQPQVRTLAAATIAVAKPRPKELVSPMRSPRARPRRARARRRDRDRRHRRVERRSRGSPTTTILLGGTSPLSGPASAYASVARGADAYFKYVNARGGVNGRTINYKYRRRRVQPGAVRAGDAPARRAGQGLRGLQLARHRAERGGSRVPEPGEGAAALRRLRRDDVRPRLQAVPVDDRLPAELPVPRAGSTASTWRGRSRAPRSPCSSRTTTTARTCSPASSRASPARR